MATKILAVFNTGGGINGQGSTDDHAVLTADQIISNYYQNNKG